MYDTIYLVNQLLSIPPCIMPFSGVCDHACIQLYPFSGWLCIIGFLLLLCQLQATLLSDEVRDMDGSTISLLPKGLFTILYPYAMPVLICMECTFILKHRYMFLSWRMSPWQQLHVDSIIFMERSDGSLGVNPCEVTLNAYFLILVSEDMNLTMPLQYSRTSGHSCPSIYVPFFDSVLQ